MKMMVKAALAAVVACGLASAANAAILYDANTTTGSVGSFVGDPDALQVIGFNTPAPQVNVNFFTVMGIRYVTIPTVAPVVRVEFYNNPNLTPGATDNVLGSATLAGAANFTLPITGVTANTSYNFSLGSVSSPLNIVTNAISAVRVTFYTNSSLTTVVSPTSGPVGRLSTGVPSIGAAQAVTYSDDDGNGIFVGGEGYVGQSSPLVGLNIRMTIDATAIPEPSALGLLAPVGLMMARRRRA